MWCSYDIGHCNMKHHLTFHNNKPLASTIIVLALSGSTNSSWLSHLFLGYQLFWPFLLVKMYDYALVTSVLVVVSRLYYMVHWRPSLINNYNNLIRLTANCVCCNLYYFFFDGKRWPMIIEVFILRHRKKNSNVGRESVIFHEAQIFICCAHLVDIILVAPLFT